MSFLSEHAVNIQFRNTRLWKLLMILALGIIGLESIMQVIVNPDAMRKEAIFACIGIASPYDGLIVVCHQPKFWHNRWFASCMVALFTFMTGKDFGRMIVYWLNHHFFTMKPTYWLCTIPHLNFFASRFI